MTGAVSPLNAVAAARQLETIGRTARVAWIEARDPLPGRGGAAVLDSLDLSAATKLLSLVFALCQPAKGQKAAQLRERRDA